MRAILVVAIAALALAAPARADPGALTIVDTKHGRYHAWDAREDSGRLLSPDEFYVRVGHPDLVDARRRRRILATGGIAVGAGLIGGVALLSRTSVARARVVGGLAAAGVGGGIGLLVTGAYFWYHDEPLSEDDAKRLAAEHNRTRIAPTADRSGAGLVVAGTF